MKFWLVTLSLGSALAILELGADLHKDVSHLWARSLTGTNARAVLVARADEGGRSHGSEGGRGQGGRGREGSNRPGLPPRVPGHIRTDGARGQTSGQAQARPSRGRPARGASTASSSGSLLPDWTRGVHRPAPVFRYQPMHAALLRNQQMRQRSHSAPAGASSASTMSTPRYAPMSQHLERALSRSSSMVNEPHSQAAESQTATTSRASSGVLSNDSRPHTPRPRNIFEAFRQMGVDDRTRTQREAAERAQQAQPAQQALPTEPQPIPQPRQPTPPSSSGTSLASPGSWISARENGHASIRPPPIPAMFSVPSSITSSGGEMHGQNGRHRQDQDIERRPSSAPEHGDQVVPNLPRSGSAPLGSARRLHRRGIVEETEPHIFGKREATPVVVERQLVRRSGLSGKDRGASQQRSPRNTRKDSQSKSGKSASKKKSKSIASQVGRRTRQLSLQDVKDAEKKTQHSRTKSMPNASRSRTNSFDWSVPSHIHPSGGSQQSLSGASSSRRTLEHQPSYSASERGSLSRASSSGSFLSAHSSGSLHSFHSALSSPESSGQERKLQPSVPAPPGATITRARSTPLPVVGPQQQSASVQPDWTRQNRSQADLTQPSTPRTPSQTGWDPIFGTSFDLSPKKHHRLS